MATELMEKRRGVRVLGLNDLDTARMKRGAARLSALPISQFRWQHTSMTHQLRMDSLRASGQMLECLEGQTAAYRGSGGGGATRRERIPRMHVTTRDGSLRGCRSRSELHAQRRAADREHTKRVFGGSVTGAFG